MRKSVLSVLLVLVVIQTWAAKDGKGRRFTAKQISQVSSLRNNVEPVNYNRPNGNRTNRQRLEQLLQKKARTANSTQENITISTMGESVNPFTVVGNGRTNLYANPTLNTVSFVRRGGPGDQAGSDGNPGNRLYFDLNTRGGADGFWQLSKGPLYENDLYLPSTDNQGARYPQGVYWAPPGSTDTTQAVFYAEAAVLNGSNGGWGGLAQGWMKASPAGPHKQRMAPTTDMKRYICEGMDVAPNGSIFFLDYEREEVGGNVNFLGRVILYKMTYNSVAHDWDSTITFIPFNGDKISAAAIGFGPDGTTGYIAINAVAQDYGVQGYFAPFVSKSTDGGTTWSEFHLVNINPDYSAEVDSFRADMLGSWVNFTGDGEIIQVEAGSPNSHKVQYSTSFDLDLTVDKFNYVHIMTSMMIAGFTDTLEASESVRSGLGQWLVDISMNDPSQPYGFIMNETKSFRGCYGDCAGVDNFTEDNRPQATRNADGSLVAFCYFDTDTADFDPTADGSNNSNPDFWVRAIRVSGPGLFYISDLARNKTKGGNAAGSMVCGNVSPYLLPSPSGDSSFVLPVSAVLVGSDAFNDPVTHLYLDGVLISGKVDSTDNMVVPIQVNRPLFLGKTSKEFKDGSLSLFLSPNPTKSSITASFTSASQLESDFIVLNAIGQLMENRKVNLQKGENKLTIKTGDFAPGIYFLKATIGDQSISRRFVKE